MPRTSGYVMSPLGPQGPLITQDSINEMSGPIIETRLADPNGTPQQQQGGSFLDKLLNIGGNVVSSVLLTKQAQQQQQQAIQNGYDPYGNYTEPSKPNWAMIIGIILVVIIIVVILVMTFRKKKTVV